MNCCMLGMQPYIGAVAAAAASVADGAAAEAEVLLLVVRRTTRFVLLQMLIALKGTQKEKASPSG
jgi:hypothetical protein